MRRPSVGKDGGAKDAFAPFRSKNRSFPGSLWCELRDSNLLPNIFGALGGSQFQQKTADMMLFSVNIMENRFGEKLRPVKGSVAMVIPE